MSYWKRNLAFTWCAQVLSLSGFGFVIPFLPYFLQEITGMDEVQVRGWTGIIAAAPALSMGLMAPVWGWTADRFGCKLMLLRAMAGGAIVMVLMARASGLYAVLVLRIVQGLLSGTIGASAALVASGTPEHRMSAALGFLSSSNFVGFSCGPLFGGIAAEAFGYRTSFLLGGALLAIGFILVVVLIREPERRRRSAAPEPDRPRHGTIAARVTAWFGRARKAGLVPAFVLIFVLRFSSTMVVPFLPLFVQQVRGTIEGAPSIMGAIQAAAGLATALAGVTVARLGDRVSRGRLIVVLLLASSITVTPLAFLNDLSWFTALYVLTMFTIGGVEPNVQSALSIKTERDRRGLSFGIQTLIGNTGWVIGPLVGGWISLHFGIRSVFLTTAGVLGVTMVVGAYQYWYARPKSLLF